MLTLPAARSAAVVSVEPWQASVLPDAIVVAAQLMPVRRGSASLTPVAAMPPLLRNVIENTSVSPGRENFSGATVAVAVKVGAPVELKLCVTSVAGAKLALPAWLALIVQVPTVRMVAVVPDTVHTPVVSEVNVTARPDDAVATSGTVRLDANSTSSC